MDKEEKVPLLQFSNHHNNHDQQEQEIQDFQDHTDEQEAPSLCDLPITTLDIQDQHDTGENNEGGSKVEVDEDFEFGSLWAACGSTTAAIDADDMCIADDIFFGGQMLPLRHSVSSVENTRFSCLSRSESVDRGSVSSSGFRSSSYNSNSTSRSSSTGSVSSAKARNPFHSYPSPSPQIRAVSRSVPNCSPKKSSNSSKLWELFRMGLVRAPPEIVLVPARRSTSYVGKGQIISRSSSSSSGSSSTVHGTDAPAKKQGKASPENARKSVGIFGGCKFSVLAIEPVPSCARVDVVKSGGGNAAVKRREKEEEGRKAGRRRNGVASRHRTFEWLKDLKIGGVLNPV